MSLTRGTRVGSYEILSAIGKGGMGEVWKAQDTKLGRDVAIKTLPEEFSTDADRLARFEREAKLLASLNHPNIAAIYGLENFGGTQFLILELVDGETLADILSRGPIPVEESLKIAVQIAEALESAHERGVIHRDLKPANIKITTGGKVKVLDFGLAKAMEPSAGAPSSHFSNSPTLSMAATAQGIILGTAAYMAPEQARGVSVDGRADVWAFGCVLYEMLTGRRVFSGEHITDILASVLARDPDYKEIDVQLSPRIAETLHRCLQKDPKRRWQAIGDVRLEIQHALSTPEGWAAPTAAAAAPAQSRLRVFLPWVAAVVLAAAVWFLKPAPAPEPRPLVRFEYELSPAAQAFRNTGRNVIALSPDGRHVVYNTINGLYLRSMDTLTDILIPGTADTLTNPFFKPDGEWVAYWSAGQLKKIAVRGGAPIVLCDASNPFGADWGEDGTILFGQPAGIMRVSQDGGKPELVIQTEKGELAYGPQLLPGGRAILFSVTRTEGLGRWDQAEIAVQALDGKERKVLLSGGSDARYVATGHLVYALGENLFAVPFDLDRLTVGGATSLVQGVQRATGPQTNTASANYGLSKNGTLVYVAATTTARSPASVLSLVDLKGGGTKKLEVPPAQYRGPRVSPDGRHIAVETVTDTGQTDILIYDLSGNTAIRRLTQDGKSTRPIWTPDSKRVTFYSEREAPAGIFWQLADGSGLSERLTTVEKGTVQFPESWSPDSRVLSFATAQGTVANLGDWSLWTMSIDNKEKPSLFYNVGNSNQFGSAFSPDGKWIAYASGEGVNANAFGIYVQPFPPTGVKYEISRTGGAWPVWSPSGNELFYRPNVLINSGVPKLNAVRITTKPAPAFTSEQALPVQGFLVFQNYRDYDMLPTGREFVVLVPLDQRSTPPDTTRVKIRAVLNWFEELKERVPVR